MRSITRCSLLVVVLISMASPVWAQGVAEEDRATVTVESSTTYSKRAGEFRGTLAIDDVRGQASDEVGEEELQECLGDREVELQRIRRPGSDHVIGTAVTAEDGTWAIRARPRLGRYRVVVAESGFAFSPGYGYGRVIEVTCSEALEPVRLGPGARVLGLQISRGELPLTGAAHEAWTLLGTGACLLGLSFVALSRCLRQRRGTPTA